MAYWGKKLNYQIKPDTPFSIGNGENTYLTPFEINKSESSESRNSTSREYPAFSVRLGTTESFESITTPNALGQRNNEYPHVLDGTVWKRWDGSAWQNVATGLADNKAKFLEFNTEAKRYTLLFDGTNRKAWDGSSVTTLTDAPATNLICVDDYRIYALDGILLKCSALGSVTDWTTADDADTITLVSAKGQGTAIASYNDVVIAWTEQSMHVLYGNDPYDFYLNDPIDDGCISDRSVIEHRGKLYFLDYGAFKVYTGGKPQEISQKIKSYLDGINLTYKDLCVSGKQGKYIYLSIPCGATTNNLTLEYDTELSLWYVHDVGYLDFVNIGEYLYGVKANGEIHALNTISDAIEWYHITGVFNKANLMRKKVLSELYMTIDLPATSTLTLSYSTTVKNDDFETLYTFTGDDDVQNTRVQIPTTKLQNIDWYRLKFSGTGPCVIYYIEETYRIKPR